MVIDLYKEPLDILEKINLCNSKDTANEEPNKLGFAKAGRQELYTLCGLIKKYKPKKILEVGVAAGGTSAVIMSAVNKLKYNADLYCVDFANTCFWDDTKSVGFVSEMAEQYLDDYCNRKLYKGRTLIQEIEDIGSGIDMVLLDTNHVMPGEILDFLVVFPYLSKNAVVIVDDTLTPIIHQLPPYNNSNAGKQIAPRLLWAGISGENIDIQEKNWKKYQYGIKMVDVDDYHQIRRLIDLLCMPWSTPVNRDSADIYINYMRKNYSEDITDAFERVAELNLMLSDQYRKQQ